MTAQMVTHPIHGDILYHIDQISVIPEPENNAIRVDFIFRMNLRHEIVFKKKEIKDLIKALQHSLKPDEYHPMVVKID